MMCHVILNRLYIFLIFFLNVRRFMSLKIQNIFLIFCKKIVILNNILNLLFTIIIIYHDTLYLCKRRTS